MKDMALWNEGDWIAAIAALFLFAFLAIGGAMAASKSDEVVGHPRGLFVLFYAEMWERFSYYGMRALLVLYLTKHWLYGDGKANLIYGAYGALVYITPVLGGVIADRYLGQRKAVIFGGILLALGHGLMAVEGTGGQSDPTINVFWAALAFIIVGSGFLKANISVIVGQLYKMTDVRRDAAYTIFYMGVNVGAALGTILVGYLGETIGWSYGFGLAGIGMVVGLIIFVIGRPALKGRGEAPEPLAKNREWTFYGIGLAAVAVCWGLIQFQDVIQTLLIISGIAMLAYTLYEAFKLPKEPRERMFAMLFLIALNPIFWGLFEQGGGSLNLYTDRYVDKGGVPTSIFQSINPIYIVLFAPIFAALWQWLGRKGLEPSAPAKFGLALTQVGLGFLVFVWGANSVGAAAMTPVLFLFLIYLLHTTGELCLSPVGLSAMARLAPLHLASFIMGAWFYMTAVGSFVAGKIGEATGGEGGEMSKELTLAIYSKIGWITIGISVVVLALSPFVKRWMHIESLERDAHEAEARLHGGSEVLNAEGALPGRA
ncbi:peptide MFS transporter [Novosphingobium sp. Gsoil 351]|uniref:peptide MFS transporter n=1 Tax=Novosphingobium sp. Gsoil 351 TaxID=2675225 RepID=UPI0012B47504|nr:peptide MFS transporter [Novosphingobium sp. Gsoil 351]QGN55366.1 MFS transporter [Novosphingobium sp. Gsoil 351]